MKIIQSLFIFLFISTLVIAQKPFEGTITMKMAGVQETETEVKVDDEVVSKEKNQSEEVAQTITLHLKGGKSVIELKSENQSMKMIMNDASDKIINIIEIEGKRHIQKMHVKSPAYKAMMKDEESEPFEGTIKKTGKSKMIGDYLCYEYVVTDKRGTGTLWATPKLNINIAERVPLMKVFMKQMGGQFLKPSDEVEGFVLEVKGKDSNDEELNININVEKKVLSDDLFQMPDLTDEEQKQLDRREKVQKLVEEYRKKMEEAKDDPQKMKELNEEFKQKILALQKEN